MECWKNIRHRSSKNKGLIKRKKKQNKIVNKNYHKDNKYKNGYQQINLIEKVTNFNFSFKGFNSSEDIFLECIITKS